MIPKFSLPSKVKALKKLLINLLTRLLGSWYLPVLIVLCGIILRLQPYITNQDFWVDELYTVSHVLGGLGIPRSTQSVGFIALTKLLTLFLGTSEMAFRFLPQIASQLVLLLFYFLLRYKYFVKSKYAQILGIALFAFSSELILFSWESKQYAIDTLFTVILLFSIDFFFPAKKNLSLRKMALFTIIGMMLMPISYPMIFVLAGILISVFLREVTESRNKKNFLLIFSVSTVILITFGYLYFTYMEPVANAKPILGYWKNSYLPFPFKSLEDFEGFFVKISDIFVDPAGLRVSYLAILLATIGFLRKVKYTFKWTVAGFIIMLTLLAALLQKYPIGRPMLFITPILILVIVNGAQLIWDMAKAYNPQIRYAVGVLVALLLLMNPIISAYENYKEPELRSEVKKSTEKVATKYQDSDWLYISLNSRHTYKYYALKSGFYNKKQSVFAANFSKSREEYDKTLAPLLKKDRVWVAFGNLNKKISFDERDYVISKFKEHGDQVFKYQTVKTEVYLFDLTAKSN